MSNEIVRRVLDFLVAKGVSPNCGRCGGSDWGVPDDSEGIVELPVTSDDRSVQPPAPTLPVYMMVCDTCGNMRMHASAIVDAFRPRAH